MFVSCSADGWMIAGVRQTPRARRSSVTRLPGWYRSRWFTRTCLATPTLTPSPPRGGVALTFARPPQWSRATSAARCSHTDGLESRPVWPPRASDPDLPLPFVPSPRPWEPTDLAHARPGEPGTALCERRSACRGWGFEALPHSCWRTCSRTPSAVLAWRPRGVPDTIPAMGPWTS
jgi:hypothetical protein